MNELNNVFNNIAIDKQIMLLESIAKSPEIHEDFFSNPINYLYDQGVTLSPRVINILSNPTLFDHRLDSYISKEFWIEDPFPLSQPVIYRFDPTITAFALGALVGKAIVAGAVGAAAAAGAAAIKKKPYFPCM